MRTRQFLRSTVWPCFCAASSANAHCVGSACRPSDEVEAIESTPMPYLPAICMPDGLIDEASRHRHVLLQRQDLQLRVAQREPLALVAEALLAAEQPDDHAERFVLAVALDHRVDAERVRVGRQRARAGAEHRPAAGHVVELHDALGDVERVVVRQRDDAGAEHDAVGALARRRRGTSRARRSSPSREEWCSPHQNSSKPRRSRCAAKSRSRWNCSVGCSPSGWWGARKVPNRSRCMVGPPSGCVAVG